MSEYQSYFEDLESRYFEYLLFQYQNFILNAGDKAYAVLMQDSLYELPRRIGEFSDYENELISFYSIYLKIKPKDAVEQVISQIPEIRKKHLIQRKRQAIIRISEENKKWWLINFFRKLVRITPRGINDFPEKTINDDGTGYIQPSIGFNSSGHQRKVEDFLNLKDPKKILKFLIRYFTREKIYLKVKEDLDNLGLTNEEKNHVLHRIIPENSISKVKLYEKISPDILADHPSQKMVWLGTQKELAELFVELKKREWIKEINYKAIQASFTNSKTIAQILKPATDPKTKIDTFDQIYTSNYKPKFFAIKEREK